MLDSSAHQTPVTVSFDVVWQGSSAKHDARMSEISMEGCYIDSKTQGRRLGEIVDFKVHLPTGPWVSLQGELIEDDYPIGFGLRFTNLMGEERRLLAQVVAVHSGKPVPPEISNQEKEVRPAETPHQERSRVLLAEDDAVTLRMLKAIVEQEGYQVVAAHDGREALEILESDTQFNAAIFDMMMPHLQGLDLVHMMKADERMQRIPVGMITAEQDPKLWDNSLAAGASVFLPKPFTPPQVRMMLRILANKAGA